MRSPTVDPMVFKSISSGDDPQDDIEKGDKSMEEEGEEFIRRSG
jgi:hypothetical protein